MYILCWSEMLKRSRVDSSILILLYLNSLPLSDLNIGSSVSGREFEGASVSNSSL